MNTTQKIIYTGFAACALASASMPAFSWTVGPRADWDNTFGRPGGLVELPPRAGEISVPGHWEQRGSKMVWIDGTYIQDSSRREWITYSNGTETVYTNTTTPPRDKDGNVIPINPEAYPIDSTRR